MSGKPGRGTIHYYDNHAGYYLCGRWDWQVRLTLVGKRHYVGAKIYNESGELTGMTATGDSK